MTRYDECCNILCRSCQMKILSVWIAYEWRENWTTHTKNLFMFLVRCLCEHANEFIILDSIDNERLFYIVEYICLQILYFVDTNICISKE